MLLFGVFSFVSLANYNTGILGSWANNGLHFLFGMGAFLSVLVIIFMGGFEKDTPRTSPPLDTHE